MDVEHHDDQLWWYDTDTDAGRKSDADAGRIADTGRNADTDANSW
jgi:hypothetical protein